MTTQTRALLYDMDGLLLDTESVHMRAYSELTRRLGNVQPVEAFKAFIGASHQVTAKWVLETLHCPEPAEVIIAREQEIYLEIVREERPRPFPGVREMFDLGDRMKLKRALVTSSEEVQVGPTMDVVMSHLGYSGDWRKYFDIVCTGERAPRRKPAPDLYCLAARELELPPPQCVALEDSPAGVTAAYEAGVRVLAVPNRYLTADEVTGGRAHYCYKTLLEACHDFAAWAGCQQKDEPCLK